MAWTDIARRHYRRDGLREASDPTDSDPADAEQELAAPLLSPARRSRRTSNCRSWRRASSQADGKSRRWPSGATAGSTGPRNQQQTAPLAA